MDNLLDVYPYYLADYYLYYILGYYELANSLIASTLEITMPNTPDTSTQPMWWPIIEPGIPAP